MKNRKDPPHTHTYANTASGTVWGILNALEAHS